MHNNQKVLIYSIAGLALGVAVGMLLAPARGMETRSKLRFSAAHFKKQLGLNKPDFSDSEMEMDATHGRNFN